MAARCTVDNTPTSVLFFISRGYILSATRCRVDCQTINAAVITLGESLGLVAAEDLIDLIPNYDQR